MQIRFHRHAAAIEQCSIATKCFVLVRLLGPSSCRLLCQCRLRIRLLCRENKKKQKQNTPEELMELRKRVLLEELLMALTRLDVHQPTPQPPSIYGVQSRNELSLTWDFFLSHLLCANVNSQGSESGRRRLFAFKTYRRGTGTLRRQAEGEEGSEVRKRVVLVNCSKYVHSLQ